MKQLITVSVVIITAFLWSETLFEVKDSSDNVVLNVSTDGLKVLNQGDTIMTIGAQGVKAYIQQDASKALSRTFSVSTTSSKGQKYESKVFEIATDDGAVFYNPTDNADEIFSISKNGITANVNPTLNRDFEVNDQVSQKGAGNLMKISNEQEFEVVNDSTMLWYKDKNAFRIGYVLIQDPNHVGRGSFASGYRSQASGKYATALGYWAQASGENSLASGSTSVATGTNSCAIGSSAYASGSSSFAIGSSTEATASSAFAAGNNTEASGLNSCAIGMGCRATGEYGMAIGAGLTLASGYGSVAIGMSAQATYEGASALGTGATATNSYATSIGRLVQASGYGSTGIGYYTDATGSYSTSLGYYSIASNTYSTAFGRNCEASGYNSTAMGYNTEATGNYSTSAGYSTTSQAYCSFTVGRYNTLDGSTTTWDSLDPLFVVGNGSSTTSRSDAMVVQKNGAVFIPSLYTATTTYSLKDLKVDSRGKLCVASKESKDITEDEYNRLIEDNSKLAKKIEEQDIRIAKLEEALKKIME